MRRGAIACFERGALNLRGNRRLLLTLLIKSIASMAVAVVTLVPVLRMLGLGDAYLQMLSGNPELLAEVLTEWSLGFEVPPQMPSLLLLIGMGGLIQVLVQTFLDAGALGVLAAGDRQAPDQPRVDQPLVADWFETFTWHEFVGRGSQLIWRLLAWRVVVGLLLLIASMSPFVGLGLLVEGTRGVALVAGCFAAFIALALLSLAWLWWWVVEMHMAWLPFGAAVREGSRSFLKRGGTWMLLTGIGGLLLVAVLVPVVLLASSLQMLSGAGLTWIVVVQITSGLLQTVGLGAVLFLIWGAAIALARGGRSGAPEVGRDPVRGVQS